MRQPTPPRWSRRALLRAGGMAAGALATGAGPLVRLATAQADVPFLPPYLADLSGNGQVGPVDLAIVRRARGSRRGFGVEPVPDFDFRADVFGRGFVDALDVRTLEMNVPLLQAIGAFPERRPVTVAWHYGWYNQHRRPPIKQTVRFKGGDYRSDDPEVEGRFNRLKNEIGISVDALSWITPLKNVRMERNYRNGYLRAPDADSRHACLLYESSISLPGGGRKDFATNGVRARLVADFARMARFLRDVRDTSPVRVFRIDGRPVLFLYASHAWGVEPGVGFEFDAMDVAIEDARERFRAVFGAYPYMVGEEQLFSLSDEFGIDRVRRTAHFDAVFSYHHASSQEQVFDSGGLLRSEYTERNLALLSNNYQAVSFQRNRYTLRPILVIPSLAAGFAKTGFRSLVATKGEYADFMKATLSFHDSQHLQPGFQAALGTATLPASIYTVGSWNEEFEGHAVFPASFNRAFREVRVGGFDFAMAIRQVFGWNHYARRPIAPA